jgi:AmmeMemoRadiSam system protein B
MTFEREPAVAGQFYEKSNSLLVKQIEDCFLKKNFGPGKCEVNETGKREIIGLVVPHAGYMYSGPVAANSYFHLASDGKPNIFIIIGPNHTGFGKPVSIMTEGVWKTPMGKVTIDTDLAESIAENSDTVEKNVDAHVYEHSIEVQIPFLQYVYKNFKFVPICMLDQEYETCLDLGNSIAQTISNKNAVVIASSDLTHFENNQSAHKHDKKALDAIKDMDPEKFHKVITSENISACGYGPITSMLVAAKKLKAKSCEIIKYATSGDITGETSRVVGYASAKVIR